MSGVTERVLVVGLGNDLRGDDGAGRMVADAIEGRQSAQVRSLPQLVPELVDDLARADRVIFVDADIDVDDVVVRLVAPDGAIAMSHHGSPASLLELMRVTGRPLPDAAVVSIPASVFELGAGLSPATASAVSRAIEVVNGLISDGWDLGGG